jgi:bifunctional non-homologous end joining protein LigD
MKLVEYRKKRDPGRTNEPFGADVPASTGPTLRGAYVVHLHDATRRHYDLRFEVGGVLASFAVPRGPSLNPDDKHLAVHTEDHPIEYLDFEAVIPEGNYGAGPMILWDRGRIRFLDGPAEEGFTKGKLDFELSGYKLHGRYALVRLKGTKATKGNEWLFFKKQDAWANRARDLAAELPHSILSGLTVEELADAPRIAHELESRAAALGAPARRVRTPLEPMLAASSGAPTSGKGWIYELKLDGVRAIARKDGRDVALTNRRRRDETGRYPEVVRAVAALATSGVVLDGEIVAFDEKGQPNFQRLGQRMHLTNSESVRRAVTEVPVFYVVFDVIGLGSLDLTEVPLVERKKLLRGLLPASGVLRVLDHVEGDGRHLLEFCRERHLEGVVAKRASSPYRPGPARSNDWVKMKCERDEDFVVVGWTRGRGRERMGALDLATYVDGRLVSRGKVGSGLDDAVIEELRRRLEPIVVDAPAASGTFSPAPRGRSYVRPEVVVRVRFLGWTNDGLVRNPVFHGVRDDLAPDECTAAPPGEDRDQEELEPRPEAKPEAPPPGKTREATPKGSTRRVVVTNRNKVFWPDEGITKGDLYQYYEAIAETMLPYLKDRPIMLVRHPDGIKGKHFYQWNVPVGTPSWIQTLRMRSEDDGEEHEVFVADSVDSLLYLANLGCIPIHVLASRAIALGDADFFTLDFDVKNSTLEQAIHQVLTLRGLLADLELDGFIKTSGQAGLHVFVPLGPGIGYDTSRAMCDLLGRLIVDRHPDSATMERIVGRRGARVYVDTGQTGPSRTIVAPYSVRAYAGATVSTPLFWDEVTIGLDPRQFSIRSVPARVAEVGDPMAKLLDVRPNIPRSVKLLEKLVRKRG